MKAFFKKVGSAVAASLFLSLVLALFFWLICDVFLGIVDVLPIQLFLPSLGVMLVMDAISVVYWFSKVVRLSRQFNLSWQDSFDVYFTYKLEKQAREELWTEHWLKIQLTSHRLVGNALK